MLYVPSGVVVDMDVMSGDVACWCVVLCTLVGVSVFSVMWLLMMLEIRVSLWSSVYECQSVECAFTLPVIMKIVMLVMCSMQYVMSVSSVACGDVMSRGGIYKFAMVRCLLVSVWILINCSSLLCVVLFLGCLSW